MKCLGVATNKSNLEKIRRYNMKKAVRFNLGIKNILIQRFSAPMLF